MARPVATEPGNQDLCTTAHWLDCEFLIWHGYGPGRCVHAFYGTLAPRSFGSKPPGTGGPKSVPQSMVEATRYFPDDDPGERQWNRNAHFVKYALGKQSLALDLQTEAGQQGASSAGARLPCAA